MDLSIIIVNWNTRDLLRSCLLAIDRDEKLHSDYATETIVVDNASTDDSLEMVVADFPWVRIIANETNRGFARANNQGIRQSSGRCVLLLNSDTEVQVGALGKLVRFLDETREAGAVGARLLNADGSLQVGCHPMLTPVREFWKLMYLEAIWPRSEYPLGKWGIREPKRVDVIKGACLMVKREALEQTGLLDERFYMYTEEVDLCYRLKERGWDIWYIPKAVVIHFGGASSKQIADEMYLELYRSKIQFYRKYGGERRAGQFKVFLAIAYLLRIILRPGNKMYRQVMANLCAF